MRSEASSIENITFEQTDTKKETTIKTALIYAGSTELKKQMQRLKMIYSIVVLTSKKLIKR